MAKVEVTEEIVRNRSFEITLNESEAAGLRHLLFAGVTIGTVAGLALDGLSQALSGKTKPVDFQFFTTASGRITDGDS